MTLLKAGRFSCESLTLLNHFMIYQKKRVSKKGFESEVFEIHLQCVSVCTF